MVSIKFSKKLVIAFKPKIPVEIFFGSSSPAFATTPTKSPSACTIGGIAPIASTASFDVSPNFPATSTNIGKKPLIPLPPIIIKSMLYIASDTSSSTVLSSLFNVAAFTTTSSILSIASIRGTIASATILRTFTERLLIFSATHIKPPVPSSFVPSIIQITGSRRCSIICIPPSELISSEMDCLLFAAFTTTSIILSIASVIGTSASPTSLSTLAPYFVI